MGAEALLVVLWPRGAAVLAVWLLPVALTPVARWSRLAMATRCGLVALAWGVTLAAAVAGALAIAQSESGVGWALAVLFTTALLWFTLSAIWARVMCLPPLYPTPGEAGRMEQR